MISVGYGTNDPKQVLSLPQAQRYWYHWYMATARGEQALCEDGKAFARHMWDIWAAPGWYKEADFLEAAAYFENPDWPEVVLSSYRHRWGHAAGDQRYAADEALLHPAPVLSVPTLILHGADDPCNPPESSAGKEAFFKGPYERELVAGTGHFPQREQPSVVSECLLRFLSKH